MLHIDPAEKSVPEIHRLLLGGIGPRPIALVSTLGEKGGANLTPFSFFNVFGSNPPVVAFSPSRRGRDATLKDTYNNLKFNGECVVNSVTYPMVEQISLASTEYPPEVDEFEKSGLTKVKSDMVKPFRVKESPFQMECRVREIVSVGSGGASANIVICEVLRLHIAEDIFRNGIIHPDLIDLVGRMSGDFYCRASGAAVFEVEKPILKRGIGYDMLPEYIKSSDIYTANNLGKFANTENVPAEEEVIKFIQEIRGEDMESFEEGEEAFNRAERHGEYRKMLKGALMMREAVSDLEAEKGAAAREPAEVLEARNAITDAEAAADKERVKFKRLMSRAAKCALEKSNTEFAWKTAIAAEIL